MTKLIVTPIDVGAPGSYRERKKFLKVIKRLSEAKDSPAAEILQILEEADELIRSRLQTDDDTPVEDILDHLSAKEFDNLLSAVAFEGADTVPQKSSSD